MAVGHADGHGVGRMVAVQPYRGMDRRMVVGRASGHAVYQPAVLPVLLRHLRGCRHSREPVSWAGRIQQGQTHGMGRLSPLLRGGTTRLGTRMAAAP